MPAREEILAIQQHEDCLRKLMQEIGNEVVQQNGQRKIGPPPSKLLFNILLFFIMYLFLCMKKMRDMSYLQRKRVTASFCTTCVPSINRLGWPSSTQRL